MKYLRKNWVKILFCLPFFWWMYTKAFWPSTVLDAPEIGANLYAKEMCSCVFLIGQTEKICLENTKQWIPASDIRVDSVKKEVNTRVLWAVAQAKFYGDEQGCRVVLY